MSGAGAGLSLEDMFLTGPWVGHDCASLRRDGLIVKDTKFPTHWRCAITGELVTLGGIQTAHLRVKHGQAAAARAEAQAARNEQADARKARRAAAKAEAGHVDVETLIRQGQGA